MTQHGLPEDATDAVAAEISATLIAKQHEELQKLHERLLAEVEARRKAVKLATTLKYKLTAARMRNAARKVRAAESADGECVEHVAQLAALRSSKADLAKRCGELEAALETARARVAQLEADSAKRPPATAAPAGAAGGGGAQRPPLSAPPGSEPRGSTSAMALVAENAKLKKRLSSRNAGMVALEMELRGWKKKAKLLSNELAELKRNQPAAVPAALPAARAGVQSAPHRASLNAGRGGAEIGGRRLSDPALAILNQIGEVKTSGPIRRRSRSGSMASRTSASSGASTGRAAVPGAVIVNVSTTPFLFTLRALHEGRAHLPGTVVSKIQRGSPLENSGVEVGMVLRAIGSQRADDANLVDATKRLRAAARQLETGAASVDLEFVSAPPAPPAPVAPPAAPAAPAPPAAPDHSDHVQYGTGAAGGGGRGRPTDTDAVAKLLARRRRGP